jgi:UTP--glucose-1-phosphate uridylyltransferase
VIRKAVFPAAGLGTRFLPATKAQPKEMLPLVDKPIIQYVIEEAVAAGLTNIIIVTGRGKNAIEDHFDVSYELEKLLQERGKTDLLDQVRAVSNMINVSYVRQGEALGLGHAVLVARDLVGDEPFAVMLADDLIDSEMPCIRQLSEIFERTEESVVALMEVPEAEVHQYGIIKGKVLKDRFYQVEATIEKPLAKDAPSRMAIIGRYVLRPEIFGILQALPPGKGGEIQLTDGLAQLVRQRQVYGCEFLGDRYDIGDKFGFVRATVAYALKRPDLKDKVLQYLKTASQ